MDSNATLDLSPKEDRPSRRTIFLFLLLLTIVTWFVYLPTTQADFIMDDAEHFLDDKLIPAPEGLYRIWFEPDHSIWNYWPLSRTSFWLEYKVFGIDATTSHTINIALHLIAVLILYLALVHYRIPNAWFIAGLFAFHPTMVESVSWITERKNVLSGVFYLLSIWSFLHFDTKRRWLWYGCSLVLFVGCLLSKTSTIMLPVILVICRIAMGRTWVKRDLALLVPFFVLSLIAGLANIWFEENIIGSSGSEFDRSFLERLLVAGRIPFFYLQKIFLPHPLIFIYPQWQIGMSNPLAYLPLITGAAIIFILLRKFRTWGRYPTLALIAFVVTLFPVLNFFDIYGMRYSFVSDHWGYLAALPIFILLGGRLSFERPQFKRVASSLCSAVLIVCAFTSWRYAHTFQNPETLWTHTLAKNLDCWLGHNNIGITLQQTNRTDEAISHYMTALELNPEYAKAHNNLGSALQLQGRPAEAFQHFQTALNLSPDYVAAHNNIGLFFASQNNVNAALKHFQAAIRLQPDYDNAYYNLGNTLLSVGRNEEAISHYRTALTLNPNLAEAHQNLGVALLKQGDIAAAIHHCREALRIRPTYEDAKRNLPIFLEIQKQRQSE